MCDEDRFWESGRPRRMEDDAYARALLLRLHDRSERSDLGSGNATLAPQRKAFLVNQTNLDTLRGENLVRFRCGLSEFGVKHEMSRFRYFQQVRDGGGGVVDGKEESGKAKFG